MDVSFLELVSTLTLSSPSNDTLHQITLILQQQQQQSVSLSAFVTDSFSPLLTLQHWAWELFVQHPEQYLHQPYHAQLLHTLASFNRTLVYHYDHIDLDTKLALLVPETIEQIDRIFELVDQCAEDNDPLISMISLWLENHAYFLHENQSYDQSPLLHHISYFIVTHYLMSDQYKAYLSQLRQSPLSESVLSARMVFYVKTCSFYVYSNLGFHLHRYPYSAEEMLRQLCDDYLEIIHVHSYRMPSWSQELLGCIGHLVGLVSTVCWWDGQSTIHMSIIFPAEMITCQYVRDLGRIIAYEPFHKQTTAVRSNYETILIESSLLALIIIAKNQQINWFFRTEPGILDTIIRVTAASQSDEAGLCGYAVLGEVLNDDELKKLKIEGRISEYFFALLEEAWLHKSEPYKQIPIDYLLKSLETLSKNDSIQQRVACSKKIIPLLIDMCDQYSIGYDILWALSFNLDIQQQLRSSSHFMSKLAQLANDSNDEQMRKITHGILWNLESNHQDRPSAEPQSTFDIMISYSHKDKVLCEQLYEHLVHAGFRVWIDFDQMHGNVMDAMAQAIERSQMIIICMSEQYRRSNYCRAEAHYAFQRQLKLVPVLLQKHYKPDGWLLFLIGQLLYVDFTKHEFDRAIEMLMKEIKRSDAGEVVALCPVPRKALTASSMMDWTGEEMQGWLVDHRLPKMGRLLQGCDGQSVVYLYRYLQQVPSGEMLRLLEEDSRLKTKESVSVTELCRFQSLLKHQRSTRKSKDAVDPNSSKAK